MTRADKVAGAYASVAGVPDPDAAPDAPVTAAPPPATSARRTAEARARAPVSRRTLLARASIAGAAIVLLGLVLAVSDDEPAAATAPTLRHEAEAVAVVVDASPSGSDLAGVVRTSPDDPAFAADDDVSGREPSAAAEPSQPVLDQELTQAPHPDAGDPRPDVAAQSGEAEVPPQSVPVAAAPVVPAALDGDVAARPAAPSATELARGFVLQLGVFGEPANADKLARELAGQGHPAHVQSRVVLGPFADRASAKAAAERLRGERGLDALVVPPARR